MGNRSSSQKDVNMDKPAGRREKGVAKRAQKAKQSKGVQAQKIAAASRTGILSLNEGKLSEIPQKILSLEKLKILDLDKNSISAIPAEFGRLVNLKKLTLSNNKLTELPNLDSLSLLETAIFNNNMISEVSALPTNLKVLSLRGNLLKSIPESVKDMSQLNKLEIGSNNLEGMIPGWLGDLPKLQILDLDDNNFESISEGLGSSSTLETLLLRRNKISEIPGSILKSASLSRMRLEGNKITKQELMNAEGFEEFDAKRKAALNKAISAGLGDTDRSVCGLD